MQNNRDNIHYCLGVLRSLPEPPQGNIPTTKEQCRDTIVSLLSLRKLAEEMGVTVNDLEYGDIINAWYKEEIL